MIDPRTRYFDNQLRRADLELRRVELDGRRNRMEEYLDERKDLIEDLVLRRNRLSVLEMTIERRSGSSGCSTRGRLRRSISGSTSSRPSCGRRLKCTASTPAASSR